MDNAFSLWEITLISTEAEHVESNVDKIVVYLGSDLLRILKKS